MEELDLRELLQVFWEKRLQIIVIIAIFAAVGVIYTIGFVTPKYESTTRLLLATNLSSNQTGTSSITATDVTLNSKLVSTYSALVKKSNKITRTVISNLALNDIDESAIKNNVTVSADSDTEFIEIKVRNEDPVLAQKIANETAKVFIDEVKEYYKIENLHIVDEAEIPQSPFNINHTKDVMIFGAIGLVVALMYVLVANMLDTTVKSAQDIEKVTGFTVLASIPLYDMNDDRNKSKKKKGGKR